MKQFSNILWLAILSGLLIAGCSTPPDYPNEPVIEYLRMNKSAIAQGNQNAQPDTLKITFGFTDGDGNLSSESDSMDVFLTDSRDGFETTFKLPVLPTQGVGNGISGEITVKIPNTPFQICCTYPNGAPACLPNDQFPTDEFYFTIQLRDRAGNLSNTIQTPPLPFCVIKKVPEVLF
jgi:hypothetical protein